MNELDLTNTQSVIFMVVAIGFLIYLNHRDRKKSAQFERENQQTIETPTTGVISSLQGSTYGEELNESIRE